MNLKKLKGKMAENDMNIAAMAQALGVTKPTFSKKLNGKGQFLVGEMVQIKTILKLTNEEFNEICLTGP